jgi:hypothetical protein
MRAHFRHLRFKSFPFILRAPQSIEIWPLKSVSEVSGVHRDSISQSGSCLGSVRVHSLTLSYTPGSPWCDSRASLWPAPLQPLCLGCEAKARVATVWVFFAFDLFCCGFFVLLLAFLWLFGAVAFIGLLPSFDLLTFSFVNFGLIFWLSPCGFLLQRKS